MFSKLLAWTFAGFMANVQPAPAPTPAPVPSPAVAPAGPPPKPEVKPAPSAPPPTFRCVGGSGQIYQHADRAYLEAWVAANDPPRVAVPPTVQMRGTSVRYGSACVGGRCPRR